MTDSRVVVDHLVMGGAPCIRGTRVPVATIVGLVAQGQSVDDIVAEYPTVEENDVASALELAAEAVTERQLPLRQPA